MKRVIRFTRRTMRLMRVASGLEAARDRRIIGARRVRGASRRLHHLLVAAPGSGNIGDQALFEAFVENTTGPVVAIVRHLDDVAVPPSDTQRVTLIAMPDLLYGYGSAHRSELRQFLRLADDASSLSIVGADIMDGKYSLRASIGRSILAEAGARLGVHTRVLGFSWNERPHPAARRALVAAAGRGAVAMVRDPRSAVRAEHDGVSGIVHVADLVFSAKRVDPSASALLADTRKPFALVNVSGLISKSFDQVAEYERIVGHLRTTGHHVVLIPHVSRSSADDLSACERVAERVGPTDVTLIRQLLTPGQIRGLTAGAALTVTGRMHLAIMTLMSSTPAITLATQGKVEGLMDLFGTPELCVEPTAGFGLAVCDAIDLAIGIESSARASILASLPRVIALAERNTAGIPAPASVSRVDAETE